MCGHVSLCVGQPCGVEEIYGLASESRAALACCEGRLLIHQKLTGPNSLVELLLPGARKLGRLRLQGTAACCRAKLLRAGWL